MSRPGDAFSSLISDVPGVDTSGFVKRTLNDLRGRPVENETPPPVQQEQTVSPQKTMPDYNFASLDLDNLGKPASPKPNEPAAAFEELFEDVAGFQKQKSENVIIELEEEEAVDTSEPYSGRAESPYQSQGRQSAPREPYEDPYFPEEAQEDIDVPQEGAGGDIWQGDTSGEVCQGEAKRKLHLKKKFEKYKTTLNEKALNLKEKGLRAMKQGIGAAQEWMDKMVEDRWQSSLSAQNKKEEAKQIERFLADLEKLSHYRREQLMGEMPAEFIQKVVDYSEARGLNIEHLFVTSFAEEEPDSPRSEEKTEHRPEPSEPVHVEDFDPLGMQSEGGNVVEDHVEDPPVGDRGEEGLSNLADPEDLDSFFTGGGSTAVAKQPVPLFGEEEDLMAFEGGASSRCKSDFTSIYKQLKASGQHSEEEIRSILKEKRLEERQNKINAALQAKLDRERDDAESQQLLHELKEQHLEKIVAWKDYHSDNMRGLLTSLDSVLWEGSGWKSPTIGDLLEPVQVKKAYMKANLIIHPDKVKQKGGSPEQIVLADMIFNVLKQAWAKFQG